MPSVYPLFNLETQLCCNGRIKTMKENKTACCGRQLMDEGTEICISNSFIGKGVLSYYLAILVWRPYNGNWQIVQT